MAQALQTQGGLPGLGDDREANDLARRYDSQIDDWGQGRLTLPKLPTVAERGVMEKRLADLRRLFQPANYSVSDRDRAAAALGRMFAGFTAFRKIDNAAEICATYLADLQDLPAFAIEAACEDIRHLRVKDISLDYPPTSVRVRKVAEEHRAKLWNDQRGPLERVLSIRETRAIPSPERQEKIGELLRATADTMIVERSDEEMAARRRVMAPLVESDRRRQEDEWRRLGLEPPTPFITVALAAQMDKKVQKLLKRPVPNETADRKRF